MMLVNWQSQQNLSLATQNIENNEVITRFQQTVPYTETNNSRTTLSYRIENPDQNQFQLKGVEIKDFSERIEQIGLTRPSMMRGICLFMQKLLH